ncbi:MAG: hypothetical protein P3A28_07175 [Gemmatimonadota bacterium]|nr:hypothetical protein [Gemmatimonadota bacterium]
MRRTPLFLAAGAVLGVACARSSTPGSPPRPADGRTISGDISLSNSPPMRYPESAKAPNPDPRIGLKPGEKVGEAGEAAFNMRLISNSPAPTVFTGRGATGSDLAFTGNYAIQGNYRGFAIWEMSNPRAPKLVSAFLCPTSQGDPTVFGNLLFISGESQGARNDCGTTPITDSVSMDRFRGVRIFDISDKANPRMIMNVQTCRGSHTNSLVQDPNDKDNIYIYVSGYSAIRSSRELANCQDAPAGDSASARFRIEVIKVPLKNPERSAVVNSPHLLADLSGRTVHAPPPSDTGTAGRGGRGGRAGAAPGGGRAGGPPPGAGRAGGPPAGGGARGGGVGQSGCHDITAYPGVGYAGGACAGYGLLFDIRDPKNPKRLKSVADSNMSFWHSATFSNDGSKLLFSDEWGGGGAPRCRATDKLEWGGNAIFTVENGELKFQSYYKMPAPQTTEEICTAHNGSLIPVPGRDIMVQAFYMGGATLFDWTDPAKPIEIGFFDRGPGGGYWSTYWYNGVIVSSDEARGLDIHELTPSQYLSQNEIDAAKTVRYEQFNSQEQPHTVWPASFPLARAYLDQLERNGGLSPARIAAIRNDLLAAERGGCGGRNAALATIGTAVKGDVASATDKGRVELVSRAITDLSRTTCVAPVIP